MSLVFSVAEADANSFRKDIDGLGSWLQAVVLGADEGFTRKFLYLGICVLEQWISGSPEF